jgi:preprotein translocase subunit YajC
MTFLLSFLNSLLGTTGAPADSATGGSGSNWVIWVIMGALLILIFVFPMITNRKKGKQINDMRTTLRIGDEIMTIGGIVGKITEIRELSNGEKDWVIEPGVGDRKATMTFDMRALHENRTRMNELKEEAAKQAEIQRIQKEQKKQEKQNKNFNYNTDENSKDSGDGQ